MGTIATEKIILKEKPSDLAELIYRMVIKMEKTYYKTLPLRVQCSEQRYRSREDISAVIKSYYPRCTETFVNDVLWILHGNTSIDGVMTASVLGSWYCTDVNRTVHSAASVTVTEEIIRKKLGKKNKIFK